MKPKYLELREEYRDDRAVDFVRPSGDTEMKSVSWCRSNSFSQVGPTVWAGDWWQEFSAAERDRILDECESNAHRYHSLGGGFFDDSADDSADGDSDEPYAYSVFGRGAGGSRGFNEAVVEELACLQGIFKPWDTRP